MADGKVVTLFEHGIRDVPSPMVDRGLFGSIEEMRGKVVFLDEGNWNEDSLLRVITRNHVTTVIDMRRRPVFRPPNYRHRHVVAYFHRHDIQYLELISLMREGSAGEKQIPVELAGIIFGRAEHGLTICFFDTVAKTCGSIELIRALMKIGSNRLVELHPRALAGSNFRDRSSC